MNSKSGAFRQLAENWRQDRLASDKILVHVTALVGLVAAAILICSGLSLPFF
jgi:hypothetical protein